LREGLEGPAERTFGGFFAFGLVNLAEAYLEAGQIPDAERCAVRAVTLARERGQLGYAAYATRALGTIAMSAEPPAVEEAHEHFRRALVLARELAMRPLVARCHLARAELDRAIGRRRQAQSEVATATWMFRSMKMTSWLARARSVQATIQKV
jgi:tetratricopeptide (TPR) repeat protein